MADTDSVNQKRNQNCQRIKTITQQVEKPELPDNRDKGRSDSQRCQNTGAAIGVNSRRRQYKRDHKKPDNAACPVGYIANHFGKADDTDIDGLTFIL